MIGFSYKISEVFLMSLRSAWVKENDFIGITVKQNSETKGKQIEFYIVCIHLSPEF